MQLLYDKIKLRKEIIKYYLHSNLNSTNNLRKEKIVFNFISSIYFGAL